MTCRLSKKYDELYQRGVEILEKHGNPCLPINGSCQHPWDNFYCCGFDSCMFLEKDGRRKKQGCTVKSLYCKIWICGYLKKEYPELNKEMYKLEKEVMRIFPNCHEGYAKEYVLSRWV